MLDLAAVDVQHPDRTLWPGQLAACLYAGAVLRSGARVRLRDP